MATFEADGWPELTEADYESLVMLTPNIASRIYDGLDIAIEDLVYKTTELADTGDYEPEDVANMNATKDALAEIEQRLSRYFYAAQKES
jgi:hypothetical protein